INDYNLMLDTQVLSTFESLVKVVAHYARLLSEGESYSIQSRLHARDRPGPPRQLREPTQLPARCLLVLRRSTPPLNLLQARCRDYCLKLVQMLHASHFRVLSSPKCHQGARARTVDFSAEPTDDRVRQSP